MGLTDYPNGVTSFGIPQLGNGDVPTVTGKVFWVDSASGLDAPGNGDAPDNAFASIDYAVGRCTAARGDLILVMEGHAETVSAAGGLDLDVAGITVWGLGNEANRPTITLGTVDTADIDIDAANITLGNCIIDMTGVDSITVGIDVNAINFTLANCHVILGDATAQVDDGLATGALLISNGMKIIGCKFTASDTAGVISAIDIVGTPDRVLIKDCEFEGTYSGACIDNETANIATKLRIENCVFENNHATAQCIDLDSACTGWLVRNTYLTPNIDPGVAASVDPGSMRSFECYACDAVDTSGILHPAAT